MRTWAQILVGSAIAVLVGACVGDDQASRDANQALAQLTKAATEMAQQAQQMAGGAAGLTSGGKGVRPLPPVSFRKLIDYLPKKLEGMKTSEPEGESGSAGQWQYSEAKASFSGEQGQSASVGIFDYAHISLMYLPYQMLTRMKVSKESTRGYERSVEMDGFPAYEEWDKGDRRSEMTVLVGDRFIVNARVNGGEEAAARRVLARVDLKGLAKETSH